MKFSWSQVKAKASPLHCPDNFLVKENFCFTCEQLVSIHIEEDPTDMGQTILKQPEVAKPLLLHQDMLFQTDQDSQTN